MPASNRVDTSLNLNLSGLPPIAEPTSATSAKSPFTGPKPSASALSGLAGARLGAGSPLHEQASRLFPKRTRELQTPTVVSSNIWGPPTSGTSTPLFEIPESPSQDGFPDLVPLTESGINSPARRGRAGTLPSRISPTATTAALNLPSLTSKTSRPTPSTSPFRPGSTSASEKAFNAASANPSNSTLLSRLRAGSMPQRANLFGGPSPLSTTSTSAFGSTWNSRARAATLTSISSADDPTSPQQTGLGKEDPGVRTLDYLGLAETPASNAERNLDLDSLTSPALAAFGNSKSANRYRSFSVNTHGKYTGETQDNSRTFPMTASGAMTPNAAAALEAEYEAIQERVRLHNQAVQDFALNASAARPRARTAGLVDTPQRSALRKFGQNTVPGLDLTNIDPSLLNNESLGDDLSNSLLGLKLSDHAFGMPVTDQALPAFDLLEDPTSHVSRSLWIGSIPNSTTVSTLDTIFSPFGAIESTRVLTHKNCGFVNFESIQDAMRARQSLNGTEIFPGAAPVRIGYAKAPSSSITPIPGPVSQSPVAVGGSSEVDVAPTELAESKTAASRPASLRDVRQQVLDIVTELGAEGSDLENISVALDSAISFEGLQREISVTQEISTGRLFDAPRLRDIRKRIDNGQCMLPEIEQIAMDMLPEIAELSSDYLGNTVVQKLFEYCSEDIKEQMLLFIAPRLAEIGIHKNGTWAAQKIIDVCASPSQINLIIEHLRPYTVPLFLDQFGNYVLQCCLRFGSTYNAFIFETMLSQMWEIAQGRFGARAMRACLESHHASQDQQRMLAAVIALHSVQLATNANGALLLTWFLDTCTFPGRRTVLAPRLVPQLVQLCTHKVAYLTVLKVVNQRNEPDARELILNALFFSPGEATLEQILLDQNSGVTLIFKIVTSPFLDDAMRTDALRNISMVLVRIKAQPNQGYKRLMDEVGLSPRPPQMQQSFAQTHPMHNDRARPMSQMSNSQFGADLTTGLNPGTGISSFGPVRSVSSDSFSFPTYGMGAVNGYQNQPSAYNNMPYQQMTSPGQYAGFNAGTQRSNNAFLGNSMNNGFPAYNAQPTSMDAFRGMAPQSTSPVPFSSQMSPMMNSGSFAQGYGQQSMNGNMYNYGNQNVQQSMYSFSPPMQTVHAGGRGRRR